MYKKTVIYLYGDPEEIAELTKTILVLAKRYEVNVETDNPKPGLRISDIIDAEKVQKERAAITKPADAELQTVLLLDEIARLRKKIDERTVEIIQIYKGMIPHGD
ncbi:MAG: hypothetical protein ABFC78_00545 [Methanoregula sp.]